MSLSTSAAPAILTGSVVYFKDGIPTATSLTTWYSHPIVPSSMTSFTNSLPTSTSTATLPQSSSPPIIDDLFFANGTSAATEKAVFPAAVVVNCYGENAECWLYSDQVQKCALDKDEQMKCLCESGGLALRDTCITCQNANRNDFPITDPGIGAISSQCVQSSYTIAPIPSSVVSIMSSYNATRNITMEGGGGFAGPMSLFTNANGRWDLKVMVTTSDDSDTTSASEIWVAITIDDGNSTTTTAASDTTSLSSLSITAATSTRYGPPMRVPNTLTISMGSVSGRYVGPGYLKRIVAVCFLSLFSGLI